jgi:hypothetical protein
VNLSLIDNFYLQSKILSVSLKPYPVMVEIADIIA